ncbi:hypothetical protein CMV_027188 [Castanea mollissima]|uniref:Uncharacterized protein n=1 Tax=Castanea mollissima TaxID=60419 RepID=A0A8J4V2Z9_9ROSI|nr:hypothetical protein CMV_027188 [Castanea mollissima]
MRERWRSKNERERRGIGGHKAGHKAGPTQRKEPDQGDVVPPPPHTRHYTRQHMFEQRWGFSLVLCLCVYRCKKGRKEKENTKRDDIGTYKAPREKPKYTESVPQQNYPMDKVPRGRVAKPNDSYVENNGRRGVFPKLQNEQEVDVKNTPTVSLPKNDHDSDMSSMDMEVLPPPPPPFFTFEKVSVEPVVTFKVTSSRHPSKSLSASSAKAFTVALLQQYTNSFSHENFIGEGTLGSVYRGEMRDGKVRLF